MMKMNKSHGGRQMLAWMGIFCLLIASTGFRAYSAQFSPPKEQLYFLSVGFMTPDQESLCQKKRLPMELYLSLVPRGALVPLSAQGDAEIIITTKLGTVNPKKGFIKNIWVGKTYTFDFTYIAPGAKKGDETVTVEIKAASVKEKATMSFTVKPCQKFKVRGSADATMINGEKMIIPAWSPVGFYDISGTLTANDNGSLSGQATAKWFVDALFTGEGWDTEGMTCNHITPFDGNGTVDIEADPNAWANDGTLDLTFTTQPMQIASTRVKCEGGGEGYGYADTPAFTIASFDLNFDALPADGGTTSLDFQFPSGRGTLKMDLIVTPEEAGS
jgi:hypothetical protein